MFSGRFFAEEAVKLFLGIGAFVGKSEEASGESSTKGLFSTSLTVPFNGAISDGSVTYVIIPGELGFGA